MSAGYKTVNWNRNKIVYDLVMWASILVYLSSFVVVTNLRFSGEQALSTPIVLMRALATCAFLALTLLLCIGPLARLSPRFLPLLYNRRHLGVSIFVLALLHAALAIFWYHSFGVLNPIESVFTSGGGYDDTIGPTFQVLGVCALFLLYLLAATSHDYWNANLGAPLWKALHMLVYPAYALLVAHITFGALQTDNTGLLPWMVGASVLIVGGLHVLAALRHSGADVSAGAAEWVDVGRWQDIDNNRAITVDAGTDQRIAVFRYDEHQLCAVANACQHQNGPLGEGRVINGKIVCPWHGYEYRPEDGCSPPPFTEKIETYALRVNGDRVEVNTTALPKGTARPIVRILPVDGDN